MAVNLGVIGRRSGPAVKEYTWKDCVLYALGIGAGEEDLEYIYEGVEGGIRVYPTFAVFPIIGPLFDFLKEARIDLASVLHMRHKITVNGLIRPQGTFFTTALCKSIYDKVKAAVANVEFETRDDRGELIFTNEMSIYCGGHGNFGGDPGPKPLKFDPPVDSDPVFTISYPIPGRQAAIYRLSGDYNALHIDPRAAKKAGFPRPVLHGLCTYGYVGRAVLKHLCLGEASRFAEFSARFASTVFAGETLTVRAWATDEAGLYIIVAGTPNGAVLDQCYARIKAK